MDRNQKLEQLLRRSQSFVTSAELYEEIEQTLGSATRQRAQFLLDKRPIEHISRIQRAVGPAEAVDGFAIQMINNALRALAEYDDPAVAEANLALGLPFGEALEWVKSVPHHRLRLCRAYGSVGDVLEDWLNNGHTAEATDVFQKVLAYVKQMEE